MRHVTCLRDDMIVNGKKSSLSRMVFCVG
jgi:hypothetical protein